MIALAAHLPASLKLRRGETKRVVRHMLRDRVPATIARRPKKGFGFPIGAWLRGELGDWAASVLSRKRLEAGGLVNPQWAGRLLEEHRAGVANHRKPLWSALALELWRSGPYGPS